MDHSTNLTRMLASVICAEHQRMKDAGVADKALVVCFRLRPDHAAEPPEDYYPKLLLMLWSPHAYTKVFLQESDPHHHGRGRVVKVGDHDSTWRDRVERVLGFYAPALSGFDSRSHWYEIVPVVANGFPDDRGQIEDARFLPTIRGLQDPPQIPLRKPSGTGTARTDDPAAGRPSNV